MNGNTKEAFNIANNSSLVINNNNQQQNINNHVQQQQQQQQQYQQKFQQQEEQAIIQYYIYEDFQNFLNLLYSHQAVKEFYKKDPQNMMIQISQNKLLTQMNLSNSIHYDLQKNYENTNLKQFLLQNKQQLKGQIRNVCPPNFDKYIQQYEQNCLNQNVQLSKVELIPIQLKVNFNDKVLQQIFPSIQTVDNKLNYIRQTKNYPIPNIQSMKSKAEQYQQETFLKLKNQSSKNGIR